MKFRREKGGRTRDDGSSTQESRARNTPYTDKQEINLEHNSAQLAGMRPHVILLGGQRRSLLGLGLSGPFRGEL